MNAEGGRECGHAGSAEMNEQALRDVMRAVLLDAITCIRGHGGAPRDRERLAREARYWMRSTARTSPFSFESICDVLEISAPYLRRLLLPANAPAPGSAATESDFGEEAVRRLRNLRMRGNQVTQLRPCVREEKRDGRSLGGRRRSRRKSPFRGPRSK